MTPRVYQNRQLEGSEVPGLGGIFGYLGPSLVVYSQSNATITSQ